MCSSVTTNNPHAKTDFFPKMFEMCKWRAVGAKVNPLVPCVRSFYRDNIFYFSCFQLSAPRCALCLRNTVQLFLVGYTTSLHFFFLFFLRASELACAVGAAMNIV